MNPAICPDTSAVVNIFAVRGKAYVSKEPPRLAAEELERIRILFLGHHARPSAVAIICHRERGEKGTDAYLYASLSVTKPNSAVEYIIRSSAILLMCTMTRLDHMRNSAMKSRSATPQRLFSATE